MLPGGLSMTVSVDVAVPYNEHLQVSLEPYKSFESVSSYLFHFL